MPCASTQLTAYRVGKFRKENQKKMGAPAWNPNVLTIQPQAPNLSVKMGQEQAAMERRRRRRYARRCRR